MERADVDLTRLVLDAVSDAHAAGPDHQWQLDLPDEPVTVTGDASRLTQVLTNLLANARTHTPPGTRVTVTLAAGSGTARVAVVDAGPGIPVELLPHVFERFARGSTSRSRQDGSTGLGLAIVSRGRRGARRRRERDEQAGPHRVHGAAAARERRRTGRGRSQLTHRASTAAAQPR